MRLLSLLALVATTGTTTPMTPIRAPHSNPQPQSQEALSDLCRGNELCWQVVRNVYRGIMLLEVKFIHEQRFVGETDDFCDRREYWQIDAGGSRRLLTADCEEQWGPDSQGPVAFVFDSADRLRLSYLEWQTDDRCEKVIASLDWDTGKIVAVRRWIGRATDSHSRCVNLKVSKSLIQSGAGKLGSPVISFHKD